MGYRLNRLDEPVFIAGPKPMLTEFGIHHRLESGELELTNGRVLLFPVVSVFTLQMLSFIISIFHVFARFN